MGSIASTYFRDQDFREKCAKLPSAEEIRNRRKSALLNPPPHVQSDAASFANSIAKAGESATSEFNKGIVFSARRDVEATQIVELMKMIEQWPSEAFHMIGENCDNAPACGCSRDGYCWYRPACRPFWLDSWHPELVKLESQV